MTFDQLVKLLEGGGILTAFFALAISQWLLTKAINAQTLVVENMMYILSHAVTELSLSLLEDAKDEKIKAIAASLREMEEERRKVSRKRDIT